MRRLYFCNRRILPADAMEKVRYIVDPRMTDEHSLGNRKGGDRLKKKKCYIYGKQITSEQVYQILQFFDKMYYELTDLEKKEFFQDFIESIELYPERMEDGRIVKQINFEFSVFYKGVESMAIRLPNEKTVEVIIKMQKVK